MRLLGLVDGQWQVRVELAEKEPGAAVAIDQVGVLADPPESGFLGDRFFEHRRAVDEDAVTERSDL